MPSFSEGSKAKLNTCEIPLITLFTRVIVHVDCTIVEGRRDRERQNELFLMDLSKLEWPHSKHNVQNPTDLSRAVDVAPYFSHLGPGKQIPWQDRRAFTYFAGIVFGFAYELGIPLRWGGDWNRNGLPGDVSRFEDLPHFEIDDGR